MPKSILLPQFFLPLSAVSFGRFVINLDHFHQDFHNFTKNIDSNIIEKVQIQYENFHHFVKHQNIASQFITLLFSSFAKRFKAFVRIIANQVRIYYLNNAEQWFRDDVKFQKIREWIERIIDEEKDIYVVVV